MSGAVLLNLASGLAWTVPGLYLARHRPKVFYGWLALLAGAGHWVAAALDSAAGGTMLGGIAAAAEVVEQPVLMAMYAFYPDGRLQRNWLRWLSILSIALAVAGIPIAAVDVTMVPALFAPSALLAIGVLWMRWRNARGDDRRVLSWLLVVGVSVTVVTIPAVVLLPTPVGAAVGLGLTLVELAVVTAATLRHQVYGLDLVLRRTLLYALLTTLVAGVFVAAVGVTTLSGINSDSVPAFGAAAISVIALAPARASLQRRVDRFVYGSTGDPYAVVAGLTADFAGASTPQAVIQSYVGRMRDALHVPWVQIDYGAPGRTVVAGFAEGPSARFSIVHRNRDLGELTVGLRRGEDALRRRERRLISDLAAHAALVLEPIALADDLQASREQVVAAREEERRRLRMDLHDGLGPQLTGIALGLDVASEKVDRPDVASSLETLRAEVFDALGSVRRLVAGLRPPRLDEVGLVGAVGEAVDRAGRGGLRITFDHGVATGGRLPAAAEVALLRIAEEAITNVVRHASATECSVRLAIGSEATLAVTNDGVIAAGTSEGTGLESMRHRAEELGAYSGPARVPTVGGGSRRRSRSMRQEGTAMTDPIRVLIVDDHDLVRAGLVGLLSGEKGFRVVGEAADGRQAVEAALRHRPDVVVMDLEMPHMGGVAATSEILRALPETGIVVLTMYDDDDSVLAALRAGARGYLLKGAARGELRSAVVAAAEGHAVFGAAVAATVVGRATVEPAGPAIPGLTKREHDVLAAMADGLSPAAIGVRLGVSPKTARNNISMILTKLGVNDRSEAVDVARRAGLGSSG